MKARLLLFVIVFVACAALSHSSFGQSGRNSSKPPPRKPQAPSRPKPHPPLPPREPVEAKEDSIRINTDLVTLVATVTEPAGTPPPALRREDFEVFEDDIPQEIVSFARDADVPLRMVMLFDTSLSVARRIGFQRRAAAQFFERVMRPQDKAALFSVSTSVEVLQDFTSSVPLLTGATRQLRASGATSLYDGIFLAAEYLKPAPGRRIIVIISDGGDTTSEKSLLQALTATQQADALIFAIFTGNPYPSQNLRDLAAERALITLTGETGGLTFFPNGGAKTAETTDDQELKHLDQAFAGLAEQLRTQYTLGFYSSNEARDGQFRKLKVRVKKAGYIARARSGYYAAKS